MRVPRFKVAILVLLVATVIYPITLHLDSQRYEEWKQSYLESHPDEAGWVDLGPYTSTSTGGLNDYHRRTHKWVFSHNDDSLQEAEICNIDDK